MDANKPTNRRVISLSLSCTGTSRQALPVLCNLPNGKAGSTPSRRSQPLHAQDTPRQLQCPLLRATLPKSRPHAEDTAAGQLSLPNACLPSMDSLHSRHYLLPNCHIRRIFLLDHIAHSKLDINSLRANRTGVGSHGTKREEKESKKIRGREMKRKGNKRRENVFALFLAIGS